MNNCLPIIRILQAITTRKIYLTNAEAEFTRLPLLLNYGIFSKALLVNEIERKKPG